MCLRINKLRYLSVILLFLYISNVSAQNFLDKTPFSLIGENLSKEQVTKAFEKSPRIFSNDEMATIKENVAKFNVDIDRQIQDVLEKRQKLVDVRQRLLQQKDNVKLIAQLEEAETSYNQILADVKKQLEGISYKGFYICAIKNIDPFGNPETLIDRAKKTITPVAVQDVLGFFIESVTEMYSSDKFDERIYKYVREEISGKLEVETKYKHDINPAERIFWYACKVSVTPLREKLDIQSVAPGASDENSVVVNTLKVGDISTLLNQKGLPSSIAAPISAVVEVNRASVLAENQSIKTRERNIIRNGQQKLDELSEKITTLQRKIEQTHVDLKSLIETNTSLKYNASDVQSSINSADKKLIDGIKKLVDQELSLRNRKLQTEWERAIATSGDPKEAIAQNVVELKKQFETSYGKIEQFIEINEMENEDFSKSQGRKVTYNRSVDHLWVFVEALQKGFNLHVIARLRINDQNEPAAVAAVVKFNSANGDQKRLENSGTYAMETSVSKSLDKTAKRDEFMVELTNEDEKFLEFKTSPEDKRSSNNSEELNFPCVDKAFSDGEFFRARGEASSQNIMICQRVAYANAIQWLAGDILRKIKSITDQDPDSNIISQSNVEVVSQDLLQAAAVVCKKIVYDPMKQNYTCYIVVELNKENYLHNSQE